MIADIRQIKNIGTKRFEVYFDNKASFYGEVPATTSLASCRLFKPDGSVALATESTKGFVFGRILAFVFIGLIVALIGFIVYFFPPDKNPLPLILTAVSVFVALIVFYLFKGKILKHKKYHCKTLCPDGGVMEFYRQSGGVFFEHNVIFLGGKTYKIYNVSKGKVEYLSVYLDDVQISQIDVDISVYQKKDYRIYLLEDYGVLADKLSLFVLYHYSINHANRGEIAYGKQREWTYSRANKYYNPSWVSDNFGGLE